MVAHGHTNISRLKIPNEKQQYSGQEVSITPEFKYTEQIQLDIKHVKVKIQFQGIPLCDSVCPGSILFGSRMGTELKYRSMHNVNMGIPKHWYSSSIEI